MAENAFTGFASGIEDGHSWAAKQAELDISRQTLAMHQANFDETKRQFDIALGNQYYNDLQGISTMAPGKAKSAAIKNFTDRASQAGINIDPVFVAGLDDPNYKPAFDKIYQNMSGVKVNDPDMFNNWVSGLVPALGSDKALGLVQKMAESTANLKKAAMETAARKDATAAVNTRKQQTEDRLNFAIAQRAHNQVVNSLKSNPELRQRMVQFQNLDNALAILDKADKLTPEQVHDFQQSIRSNLGIRGTGGVDERAATYLDSLGLQSARWKEFLSGKPADLAKNDEIINHLRDVAHQEQANIQKQTDVQIDQLAEGQGHIYEAYPKLKESLKSLVAATKGRTQKSIQREAQSKESIEGAPAKASVAPKESPNAAEFKPTPALKALKAAWDEGHTKEVLAHPAYKKLSKQAREYVTGGE